MTISKHTAQGPEDIPAIKPKVKRAKRHTNPPSPNADHWSRAGIMEEFGWSATTLWRAMRELGLPYRKVGRVPIFPKAEVKAWQNALPGQRLAG